MPGTSGRELAEQIQREENDAALRIKASFEDVARRQKAEPRRHHPDDGIEPAAQANRPSDDAAIGDKLRQRLPLVGPLSTSRCDFE